MLGRNKEAIAELEALKPPGLVWVQIELASANARAGRSREARRILSEIEAGKEFADPFQLATVYAALGDFDTAFRCLERSYNDRSPQIAFILSEPRLDPIRSDARFGELVKKLNLA
jgi:hypothetical protein